ASPSWDQLPSAEDLRNHAAAARARETDPTFFARLITSPSAIQFMPKPLDQPTSLCEFDESSLNQPRPTQVSTALFTSAMNSPGFVDQTAAQSPVSPIERSGRISRAFSLDTMDPAPPKADVSASIITPCVETPVGCLEQAQQAAQNANTPDELSSI